MRKIIAIEGRDTVPGQFLEPSCLKWNEGEVYPLVWNFSWERPPIGTATDIRREDDGTLTAELTITDEQALALMEHGDGSATFYANEVASTLVKNDQGEVTGRRYISCQLRALSLVPQMQVTW